MSSEEIILCAVSTDSALKSQVSWELVGWSGVTVSTDTVLPGLPGQCRLLFTAEHPRMVPEEAGVSSWSAPGAVNTADRETPWTVGTVFVSQ